MQSEHIFGITPLEGCFLKPNFIKEQEASRLLSFLRIKAPLRKLPLLGDILFQRYKMNKIINRILSVGDKFITAMHLRQLGFTHCACRTITKNKEGIKKIEETGDSIYIYQIKLDKACFQHNMADGGFKDWPRRTPSDKVLHDKALKISTGTCFSVLKNF